MTLIKEIHNSFSSQEEAILAETKQLLNKEYVKERQKKASKLKSLGFTGSKAVSKYSPEQVARAEALHEKMQEYKHLYPQNAFITEEKITEICKKYGLVFGSVELYKEDIPDRNVDEIVQFMTNIEGTEVAGKEYENFVWQSTKGGIRLKDMEVEHLVNAIQWLRRTLNSHEKSVFAARIRLEADYLEQALGAMLLEAQRRDMIYSKSRHSFIDAAKIIVHDTEDGYYINEYLSHQESNEAKMLIAADIKSFEPLPKYKYVHPDSYQILHDVAQQRKDIEEEQARIRAQLMMEYDPIVLYPVDLGYLVVSAWGDEASDAEITSPSRN